MIDAKHRTWKDFCQTHQIAERAVPLFALQDRDVIVRSHGRDHRLLLTRSAQMEQRVLDQTHLVVQDYHTQSQVYEGVIYMMFWLDGDAVLPLYIGKSEKYGRRDGNLSANISGLATNRGKFCRWGDNYAYHIGDLSAVVCPGHPASKINHKYTRWADQLFETWPTSRPRLRHPTWFWIKAWRQGTVGIWRDYGATSLTFLEYLLIGVASDLFPTTLLNSEGVNRQSATDA